MQHVVLWRCHAGLSWKSRMRVKSIILIRWWPASGTLALLYQGNICPLENPLFFFFFYYMSVTTYVSWSGFKYL